MKAKKKKAAEVKELRRRRLAIDTAHTVRTTDA